MILKENWYNIEFGTSDFGLMYKILSVNVVPYIMYQYIYIYIYIALSIIVWEISHIHF